MRNKNTISKWLFRKAGVCALLLFILISHTANTKAQKLPPLLSEGSTDPSAFDINSINKLKTDYETKVKGNDADREEARQLRNRLVGIGVDQVDALYFDKLKGDRKKIRLVQFILDFLEIGAATAISLTNGERAKSVISEGLGALQSSRTSLNKNFQLLERQLIINKMEADRATVLASIHSKLDRDVIEFPWEIARADLRTYRDAGTLDSALASLSASVGNERITAQENLRQVKDKPITGPATAADLEAARGALDVEDKLEEKLDDATKKADALATLKKIVEKLEKDEVTAKLLKARNISSANFSATTDGKEIIKALDEIKESATIFNKRDVVRKINLAIVNPDA
jgi:hypothetical protein